MNRLAALLTLGVIFMVLLTACQGNDKGPVDLKIGTISGPETQLMEISTRVAHDKYGLIVKIIPFRSYTLPNTALADGSIDANVFQHKPYLEAASKAHGYNFAVVGKTFIYPMGLYSKKITSLKALKKGDSVGIPNDPNNEARALLLLQKAKLITLKAGANTEATIHDIVKNPYQLNIIALAAAQLPRLLGDLTLAVINTNYAVPAGLYPTRDALFKEGFDSQYANLIVVRKADANNPKIRDLVKSLNSPEVKKEAETLFHGQAIPAW